MNTGTTAGGGARNRDFGVLALGSDGNAFAAQASSGRASDETVLQRRAAAFGGELPRQARVTPQPMISPRMLHTDERSDPGNLPEPGRCSRSCTPHAARAHQAQPGSRRNPEVPGQNPD